MDNLLRWYAVYTRSRYEKKSAFLLNEQGIEAYVPLRRVLRQWSDRRKLVFEPVIHSYVFVKANKMLYEKVLGIEGVVRYIYFGGKPAPIPDRQIETMKTVVGTDLSLIHISEPTRLLSISYAVFCLKKKKIPLTTSPKPLNTPKSPHHTHS